MSEEARDWWLAEYILDEYEAGGQRSSCSFLLSALAKVNPRARYRTSWKTLDVWTTEEPVRQAPAAPPELLSAMFTIAVLLGRPEIGVGGLLCYAGLLRVREMLTLRTEQLIIASDSVIIMLGQTKRGLEQKVVLLHPTVVAWVRCFVLRTRPAANDRVFRTSYSTFLSWIRKLAQVLDCETLGLTTHSLRRSGASELSRQGVPLMDLLAFGRWLSPRAAREYIRRGEVAVTRVRRDLPASTWERIRFWSSLSANVWSIVDVAESFRLQLPRWQSRGVKRETVESLECLFGGEAVASSGKWEAEA
jgi:integrase